VLPSEGTRRADLEVRNIRVAGKTDLLLDVTLRHLFIGAGRSGHTQGQLRNMLLPVRTAAHQLPSSRVRFAAHLLSFVIGTAVINTHTPLLSLFAGIISASLVL
jgi:hypothetical protein